MARIYNKKSKDANTSSEKLTAAQMKELYEKRLRNFEEAQEGLKRIRDITKNSTKSIAAFDKETLRGYLRNIGSNEANLRNLSWYLYYRSQVYARIVNFYANMFCLDCRSIVPDYDLTKDVDPTKTLKSYQETVDMVDSMRLQGEMYNAILPCFVQDVFYGIVFYDDTGIFIYPFPADYAKISGKYTTGDFSFAIDCSYFNRHDELLDYFPEPFKTLYDEYQRSREKWQEVPEEYALCLKFRSEDYETVLPPLASIFNSIINLIDLEDIQAVAAEQEIYKLLWIELETINGSDQVNDWKVDPSVMIEYFNRMVNDALPDYISAVITPGKINEISFPDDKASDTTKVANATETVLNTAGGAEILNGATINNTYAFKMACIQNTEYAISSLLPQIQSWVNRFVSLHISNPAKIKFFPISVYTKQDYKEQLLSAGQNGLPTKLAYNTLNGFSEKDTLALNFLEEEVLKLSDKLRPFDTSYTQSGKTTDGDYTDEVGQGAPVKDEGDLSDSGEKSRNK